MDVKQRKLEAEWIIAQSILGEIGTEDYSEENYNNWVDKGFFNGSDGKCRISLETWSRYWDEKAETNNNIKFNKVNL